MHAGPEFLLNNLPHNHHGTYHATGIGNRYHLKFKVPCIIVGFFILYLYMILVIAPVRVCLMCKTLY